jgi:GntR family transcriptional regulator
MDSASPRTEQAVADLTRYFTSGEFPPGATLPSVAQLHERFDLPYNVVNSALAELRARGLITTINGKGSVLIEAPPPVVVTRDANDPTRHLTPIGPVHPSKSRATAVQAQLFDVRDRAPLFLTERTYQHRTTGARVYTVRVLPGEVLFPFDPEPDPHGEREPIMAALGGFYGPLQFFERYRVIARPSADSRPELDISADRPVIEQQRLTRASSGKLLMTETEITEASAAAWEYRL